MKNKKSKVIIITISIIAIIIIIGIVYALASGELNLSGKVTTGSVKIENNDFGITKENGEKTESFEPGDVDILSWTTKNIGTSAVLTRHTIEIYWDEVPENEVEKMLYIYPANMLKSDIIEDFGKKEGTNYNFKTEKISKKVDEKIIYGIKFQFIGDTLDGTNMTGMSKEINYNSENWNNATDDSENALDKISYKILLNPNISYLYQNKSFSIKVITEAMQYTKTENEKWKVVDTQEIND